MKYKLIFGVQEFKLNVWRFISPTFGSKVSADDYVLSRLDAGHMHLLKVKRIWRMQ